MDPDDLPGKKGGRERGATAYSTTEHVALLSIMTNVPDSFNALESSPQWEAVFKLMMEQFYLNKSAGTSSTLHGFLLTCIVHTNRQFISCLCPAMIKKTSLCLRSW
jgi:hypothetical protein